jgi:hypothetical protein
MTDAKSIEREIKEKEWITPEELQNYYRLNVLRKNYMICENCFMNSIKIFLEEKI